jgi:hypothetical protein
MSDSNLEVQTSRTEEISWERDFVERAEGRHMETLEYHRFVIHQTQL